MMHLESGYWRVKNDPYPILVGGFNPSEKCWSNWIISLSRVDRVENKKSLKPPPRIPIFNCLIEIHSSMGIPTSTVTFVLSNFTL